jgi:hypothetical protein
MEGKPTARPRGNYSIYRRFAYYLVDGGMPSQVLWQAKFPSEWETELNSLAQYISSKDRNWHLPYNSLAKVLLLTIPSGITPGFDSLWINKAPLRAFITAGDTPPDTTPVTTIVRGWANFEIGQITNPGSSSYPEIHSRLNNLLNGMSPTHLKFQDLKIDLPLDPKGQGLFAENESYFYKALPAWIVRQLQEKVFYVGDMPFKMIRAQRPGGKGLELVSWPPQPFGKGYLSLVLTFDVQTIPGRTNHPIIYPKLHIRRWVYKPLLTKNTSILPSSQSTTVMVRTDVPWLPDLLVEKQALAATGILSKRNPDGLYLPAWDDNLPDLLKFIGARPLISPEEFAESPDRFNTSPEMSCILNNKIIGWLGKSPIGDGLFPGDLMILHEQVDAELRRIGLARVPDQNLDKLSLARTNRNKNKTIVAWKEIWHSVQVALSSRKNIVFEVFYQYRQTAEAIWAEFVEAFGIANVENIDPFEPNGITVQSSGGYSIAFRAVLNNYLSVEIGIGQTLKGAQAELVSKVKAEQSEIPFDTVGLSIIELKNYYSSKKRNEPMRDAKRTLRFAFAQTGRLTQFFIPEDTSGNEREKEKAEALIKTKAHAAVLDIRRQLGYMGNDLSEMLEEVGLQPGTQLIGLHLEVENVSLRSKRLKEEAVFFPSAVKLIIGQKQILAATPDAKGDSHDLSWEPYFQTELRLGTYSGSQLRMGISNRSEGGKVLERFIEQIVEIEKDKPTLIFVPSNEWRTYWEWLQDKLMSFDHMKLNNSIYLPASHGLVGGNTRRIENIRVIRYRFGEVPAYLTLDPTKGSESQAGYGHGVCKIADRIYYSIAQKPDSYQASYNWSRFSESASGGYKHNARMSALIEVVPAFLQLDDDPDMYARAFHLLRAAASHWVNGFTRHPLPSHLANNLTEDYISMRSSVNTDIEVEEE